MCSRFCGLCYVLKFILRFVFCVVASYGLGFYVL